MACSAPTARARRRRSKSWKGCSTPPPARSRSWACAGGRDATAIRERIGISLQETRLADKLTVRETVTLFRSFYRTGIEPDEAIRRVSLEEKADARGSSSSPAGKSSGWPSPAPWSATRELLFLDEPTTGLDPQSRRQLWDVIRSFKATGRTVMLTTHYMDEAERLCDRVAIVDHGKVIALGTPPELIARLGGEHIVDFQLADGDAAAVDEAELRQLPIGPVGPPRRGRLQPGGRAAAPRAARPAGAAASARRALAELTTRHATLEDVFVSLTGRHLREDDQWTSP